MKMVLLFGLLFALTIAACANTPAATPIPTQPPPTSTPGAPGIPHARIPFLSFGTWQTDVTFCKDQDQALPMDVYFPDEFKRNPAPVGIFLHELGGEKNGVDIEVVSELLKRGYVVAAPNWRQPPDYKMPIAIEDAKCAVRHLRANAATYRLDANRIGAWGCSVGGTLTALLGVTDAAAGLEGKSGFPDQSSQIQAVVTRDGIYDWSGGLQGNADAAKSFGFSSLDDPMIGLTSPMTHISKADPPFLIFRSDSDNNIGPKQTQGLYEALQAASVHATLVHVQGADHCAASGNPSAKERAAMIADFFDKSLR